MTASFLDRLVVLALTLAVAAPVAPRGLVVLCLGADGHVAVENVSEHCADIVATCATDGATSCSDGCGPCRDVGLIIGAHASGRPSNDSMLAPLSVVATPVWSLGRAHDDAALRHAFAPSQPRAGSGISLRALVPLLI